MRPIKTVCKDNKTYERLRPWVWPQIIIRAIAESSVKLKCPFEFDKNHVYQKPDESFFVFDGYCSLCHTYIKGTCSRNFNYASEEVTITIETYDTRGIDHENKKTHLRSLNRKNAETLLDAASAKKYRDDEIEKKWFMENLSRLIFIRPEYLETFDQKEGKKSLMPYSCRKIPTKACVG